MWTITNSYFNHDPTKGDLNVAGQQFRWTDGVFSVALGDKRNNDRQAYFHPMVSTNEFSVSSNYLNNEAMATQNRTSPFHVRFTLVSSINGECSS